MKHEEFELKEEHLQLLERAYWEWHDCEYGAPSMDPKRPYGNSDVTGDVAEIIGEQPKKCPHCDEFIYELDTERYDELHRETLHALEVICQTRSFELGVYVRPGNSWETKEWRWRRKE